MVESFTRNERLVIGVDFNGHVVEENRGDEELLARYCVKDRNAEGQMLVDFAKRMEVAVVNSYFKKREEHIVMYDSEDRCTQVRRRCIRDCKVVSGENVGIYGSLGSMEELPDDWESTAEVGGQWPRKRLGYPLDRERMKGKCPNEEVSKEKV